MDALEVLRRQVEAGDSNEVRETLMALAGGGWEGPEVLSLRLFEDSMQWS
jgi:hypothetical protein